MSTRTDIHRPSSEDFDPQKYTYSGAYCNTDRWSREARTEALNILQEDGWTMGAGNTSKCGHCGAHLIYSALMLRKDVKQYIFVGETCLSNRFPLAKVQFQTLRKQAKLNRERANKADKRETYLANHPEFVGLEDSTHYILADLGRSIQKYGSLTEKQEALAIKIMGDQIRKAEREAEWKKRDDALKSAGVAAPEGKGIVVRGKIVKRVWKESDYGDRWVWTVQHEDGWKVWGTVPSNLAEVEIIHSDDSVTTEQGSEVGDIVEFTANLKHFDGTTLMAGAKLPRNARVITHNKEAN